MHARSTRTNRTHAGFLAPAYAVYDAGRLIGAIVAPDGAPAFGAAAPTVLLAVRSER